VGKAGIENLLLQQANVSPFNAELRMGGLYDSRVGSASGGGDAGSDTALATTLTAGWQAPLKGNVGLRLDYKGYMDFHKSFKEYNVIDQSLSLEPQYRNGQFIYSLPFSFNITLVDNRHDNNRYSVSPTVTYLIPDTRQAVALYAIGSRIEDRKNKITLDEDGTTFGGGGAYLYIFENKSRVRLSLDYQHTTYNARVVNYATASVSADKREDNVMMAGLDFLFQLTGHVGLYVNYAFIHSNSNVKLYEYDRHVVEGGVALRF